VKANNTLRFITLLLLVVAAFGCSDRKFRQPAQSAMSPTIQPNEVIVADMGAYKKASPQRWEVVVFHPPKAATPEATVWPLRVVGLPGERISIESDGIHIDGKLIPQPNDIRDIRYTASDPRVRSAITFPYTVPTDSYFVLGDNTTNSFDSRFWGAVQRPSILGRVRSK
jgi:signal peptidase I